MFSSYLLCLYFLSFQDTETYLSKSAKFTPRVEGNTVGIFHNGFSSVKTEERAHSR